MDIKNHEVLPTQTSPYVMILSHAVNFLYKGCQTLNIQQDVIPPSIEETVNTPQEVAVGFAEVLTHTDPQTLTAIGCYRILNGLTRKISPDSVGTLGHRPDSLKEMFLKNIVLVEPESLITLLVDLIQSFQRHSTDKLLDQNQVESLSPVAQGLIYAERELWRNLNGDEVLRSTLDQLFENYYSNPRSFPDQLRQFLEAYRFYASPKIVYSLT